MKLKLCFEPLIHCILDTRREGMRDTSLDLVYKNLLCVCFELACSWANIVVN